MDARRAIADLRELDRLTGGPGGARRVCWTDEWRRAREFLRERLADIDGVQVEVDEAGNLWATLPGEVEEAVAVGSHLDSVPAGGWLDGALGVMAALEVLRSAERPHRTVKLVDFADEEGARFGRSLLGSSAVGGTLDPDAVRDLRDSDGRPIADVLAEHGVELDRMPEAAARREALVAYLELHIEQGPVLEREGVPVAAVSGTAGVERHRLTFTGQASHAGTTPMELRRDAGLAAARTALAVEEIARRHGGVGTTGAVRLEPGIPTAVPGRAELLVDLRHAAAGPLEAMLAETRACAAEQAEGLAAGRDAAADREAANGAERAAGHEPGGARASAAAEHSSTGRAASAQPRIAGRAERAAARRAAAEALAETEVWRIEPVPFDERLVAAAEQAAGTGRTLPSGALHDAAEMARHVPTAMMFVPSTGGLSHAKEEDTPEADLVKGIEAFGRLAARAIAGEIP
jgi:hydantoinase/carbamoylase family amidase